MNNNEQTIFTDIIDNRDTEFTIDQYSIFTLDNAYEMEIDYLHSDESAELRADYGLPEFDDVEFIIDDYLDFQYDKDGEYHEALAQTAIDIIEECDVDEGPNLERYIIQSIELVGIDSPQFYNYTTDSFTMSISYDREKLAAWIGENGDKLATYLDEHSNLVIHDDWRYDPTDRWGNTWIDALYSVWLLTYLEFLYEQCDNGTGWDYISEMFDRTSECSYQAIDWTVRADKLEECEQRKKDTASHAEFLRTQLVLPGTEQN